MSQLILLPLVISCRSINSAVPYLIEYVSLCLICQIKNKLTARIHFLHWPQQFNASCLKGRKNFHIYLLYLLFPKPVREKLSLSPSSCALFVCKGLGKKRVIRVSPLASVHPKHKGQMLKIWQKESKTLEMVYCLIY